MQGVYFDIASVQERVFQNTFVTYFYKMVKIMMKNNKIILFSMIFSLFTSIFLFFDEFLIIHFFIKNQSLIFRKNWIIKKSSKNKNIDQNNEKNIENNMILLFFIIIFPFCKNNLQKCFKKPFLGQDCEMGSSSARSVETYH